jgi:NADH dehydrogenase FAD-containing subunit
MRDRKDLLNSNLNWIRDSVSKVTPESNTLELKNSDQPLSYDFLVVCSGVELRYDLIEGSKEALEDADCPVGSMYKLEYAQKMSRLRESFKKGKAIFTLP